MKKKIYHFTALLLFFFSLTLAQDKKWTANLGVIPYNEVEYIKKAGTGTVLIGTKNNIYGISSKEKKIIWQKNFFFDSKPPTIKINNQSAFITITKEAVGFNKKITTILNSETGNIIFSNEESDINSKSQTFLENKKAIINVYKKNENVILEYIDSENGELKWSQSFDSEDIKGKGLISSLGALAEMIKVPDNTTELLPIYIDKRADFTNNLMVYSRGKIFCLDEKSGNIIWTKKAEKEYINAVTSDDGKYVFYNDKGKINYLDFVSGEVLLSKDISNPLGAIILVNKYS